MYLDCEIYVGRVKTRALCFYLEIFFEALFFWSLQFYMHCYIYVDLNIIPLLFYIFAPSQPYFN